MDAQPVMFSGTLKVRAYRVFWTKTPVQLTYYHQDYRHALPVLLVRRTRITGRELRIPLDPCIHPVRLLPVSRKKAAKFEFTLTYGWHTKQLRLRAPDADTYKRWQAIVGDALVSGRRPLASTSAMSGVECVLAQGECCSLGSTANSSSNSTAVTNVTINRAVGGQSAVSPSRHEHHGTRRLSSGWLGGQPQPPSSRHRSRGKKPRDSAHQSLSPDSPVFRRPRDPAACSAIVERRFWPSDCVADPASLVVELLDWTLCWFALL